MPQRRPFFVKFPSYAILCARLLLLPLGLLPAGAFAVSLGDELILSRLGDPVEVEVEVLQWEDMDLERVQISAASREEYEVFKLTWLPVLEHLDFNLVGPDLDGDVRVLISSRDPLDEPFLELLLVLRWPGGSLRREYVLLFDPPEAALAITQSQGSDVVTQDESVPIVETTPQRVALVAPPQPVESAADAADVTTVTSTAVPGADTGELLIVEEVADVVMPPAVDESNVVPPSIAEADVVVPPTVEGAGVATPSPAEDVASTAASAPQSPQVAVPQSFTANVTPATDMPQQPTPQEPIVPQAADVPEVADLPDAADTPVAVIADEPAPVVAEPTTAGVQPPESRADARTQVAVEVETLAPRPGAAPIETTRRTYQVRSGDSLWNIARQFRPAGAGENLYQMLLGIHDLNRNSFINGNISLLKTNALLQMPTEADVAAIDAATAQAEFDRRWDAGTERFDSVQRGEAIPLFAGEVPEEAPMLPIEPELPPGTELPPASVDGGGLIMVSAGNATPPLQLALVDEAPPQDMPTNETDAGPAPALPAQATAGASRVVVTTELETELAAMRVRRESAEALARQLQDSLQRAQAERAAEAALLSPRNLPLAGGALALLLALVAGVVFLLKLAGELRAARVDADIARVLPRSGEQPFGRAPVDSPRNAPPRTEPTLTEPGTEPQRAPRPRDVADAAQIEVVELEAPGSNATAAASGGSPDDLFARMDDMLGAAKKSPQK